MTQISKIIEKNNLIYLASLILIITVFVNFSHNHFQRYQKIEDNKYIIYDNSDFKKNINTRLSSDQEYSDILNKNCEVSGNMHDRHKVRWIKALFLKTIFQNSYKLNENSPYLINIFLHSLLIFFSLIILNRTLNLDNKFTAFFLLYVTFVFQNYLGEYSTSIFEMFFMSCALYASKSKKIILLTTITLLAFLNRESGIILLFTWLIFNSNFRRLLMPLLLLSISFLLINLHIIKCMINPQFFIPLEHQDGQVNFSDLFSMNLLSMGKLFATNFILPFGVAIYCYIKSGIKNNFFLGIIFLYFLVFLFAIPLHHMAVRLIILPLIFTSFYFLKNREEYN